MSDHDDRFPPRHPDAPDGAPPEGEAGGSGDAQSVQPWPAERSDGPAPQSDPGANGGPGRHGGPENHGGPEPHWSGVGGAPAAGGGYGPYPPPDATSGPPGSPHYPGFPGPAEGVAAGPVPPPAAGGHGGEAPGRGGSGRVLLAVFAVMGLMVLSAVGGGVAGAALFSQVSDDSGGTGGATRVVDGAQLDYTSLASISSQVRPSVVSIQVGAFGGSGVVASEEGHIITNAHVVDVGDVDEQIVVRFTDGQTARAQLVGADQRSDIAVIQAEGVTGLTPADFGVSDDVLVGDTVLAIGSPLGYEGSVTQGIISALDRTLRPEEAGAPTLSGLLQTDAAINRGNSGGALVNLDGQVIGINTAIAVQGGQSGFVGLGFAVPSSRAMDVAEQIIAGEEVSHAFLGVSVTPAEQGGAMVREVTEGSPADQAGLQDGDVVVRLGERPIADANDLVAAVQASAVGEEVEIEYERDDESLVAVVTLGEAPD